MQTYGSIDELLARMRDDLRGLAEKRDARRFFHATYLRTTEAISDEIDRGGFIDGDWMSRWDLAFATLYLVALDADQHGTGTVSQPWRVAFAAADEQPDLPPLRHVLFGLNAHINYDLPQALIAVINSDEFDDPAVRRRREADHGHVDDVLRTRVSAEDSELSAVSKVTLLDRLLRPLNQAASRRFLGEARRKVWHNAAILDRARRNGRYAETLAELERLSAARVRDLTGRGPVLLKLALRGFGVKLPDR